MPIYTFKCAKCGNQFDLLIRKSTNIQKEKCSSCGSKKIKKIFSPIAIHGTKKSNSSCNTCSTARCSDCN